MSDYARLAADLVAQCARRRHLLATAESCTGGMIAAAITDVAGASAIFDRGFVTYSNEAKAELLGVAAATLAEHGAVSAQTAAEMAAGALARSRADVALSVTGIAGPGGGTENKPVGTVWFGLAKAGGAPRTVRHVFADADRATVRQRSVAVGLELLLEATG